MSREQYTVPTTSSQSFGGAGGGSGRDFGSGNRDFAVESAGSVMHYKCGDCAVRVPLEKGAPIRCQKCGARVLYKERTKR